MKSTMSATELRQIVSEKVSSFETTKVWDFEGMGVGDKGLTYITENLAEHVESLNLKGNGIGDEGVKMLVEVAEELPKLVEIDLSDNSISSEGAKQLAKLILGHKTLKVLDLSDNKGIGRQGAEQLHHALVQINYMVHVKYNGNNFAELLRSSSEDVTSRRSRTRPRSYTIERTKLGVVSFVFNGVKHQATCEGNTLRWNGKVLTTVEWVKQITQEKEVQDGSHWANPDN